MSLSELLPDNFLSMKDIVPGKDFSTSSFALQHNRQMLIS